MLNHVSAIELLLDAGASVDQRGSCEFAPVSDSLAALLQGWQIDELTPLMEASRQGMPYVARLLVDKSAEISAKDSRGNTALHHAATGGSGDCVNLLLESGADASSCDNEGITALMRAAHKGHLDCIQLIALHAQTPDLLNQKDRHGNTALSLAAAAGHYECVEDLCDMGASIACSTDDQRNPFLEAAMRGDDDMVALLVSRGANVLAHSGSESLVEAAVLSGSLYLIRLFAAKAIDVLCASSSQCCFAQACFDDTPYKPSDLPAGIEQRVVHLLEDASNTKEHRGALSGTSWALRQAVMKDDLRVTKLLTRQAGDPYAKDGEGRTSVDLVEEEKDPRHQEIKDYLLALRAARPPENSESSGPTWVMDATSSSKPVQDHDQTTRTAPAKRIEPEAVPAPASASVVEPTNQSFSDIEFIVRDGRTPILRSRIRLKLSSSHLRIYKGFDLMRLSAKFHFTEVSKISIPQSDKSRLELTVRVDGNPHRANVLVYYFDKSAEARSMKEELLRRKQAIVE